MRRCGHARSLSSSFHISIHGPIYLSSTASALPAATAASQPLVPLPQLPAPARPLQPFQLPRSVIVGPLSFSIQLWLLSSDTFVPRLVPPAMAFRASPPRLLFPALFGAALAKKAALYAVAHTYGFPRIYRRLLELERTAYPNASPIFRSAVRTGLKQTIRYPHKAAATIAANPQMLALLGQMGSMRGVTDSMRSKVMEGLSALMKASGVDEKALWQKAKEEERKHT